MTVLAHVVGMLDCAVKDRTRDFAKKFNPEMSGVLLTETDKIECKMLAFPSDLYGI